VDRRVCIDCFVMFDKCVLTAEINIVYGLRRRPNQTCFPRLLSRVKAVCVYSKRSVTTNMGWRNSVICCYEKDCPKVTAYEMHELIRYCQRLDETDVSALQVDGILRQVVMKFTSAENAALFSAHQTQYLVYTHTHGERSQVRISPVGIGIRIRRRRHYYYHHHHHHYYHHHHHESLRRMA
jgi:hypothetical protein